MSSSSDSSLPRPPAPPSSPRSPDPDDDDSMKVLLVVVIVVGILLIGTALISGFLYFTLPEPDFDDSIDLVHGNLDYEEDLSQPENGSAVFNITLQKPSQIRVENTQITVLNSTREEVTTQVDTEWKSERGSEHLEAGDKLIISSSSSEDIRGYQVRVRIKGEYIGTLYGYIPSG